MKYLPYAAAAFLAVLLTRAGSFLGLPGYVFIRFEQNVPMLRGEPSRIVAGLIFFAPAFIVAGIAVAATVSAVQRRARGAALLSLLVAPFSFAVSQSLAVLVYAAFGIHIYNAGSQVIAAGVSGFVFGVLFCSVAFVLATPRERAQPN